MEDEKRVRYTKLVTHHGELRESYHDDEAEMNVAEMNVADGGAPCDKVSQRRWMSRGGEMAEGRSSGLGNRIAIAVSVMLIVLIIMGWISNRLHIQSLKDELQAQQVTKQIEDSSEQQRDERVRDIRRLQQRIPGEIQAAVQSSDFKKAVAEARKAAAEIQTLKETATDMATETEDLLSKVKEKGSITDMWVVQPRTHALMKGGGGWSTIPDTSITFELVKPASVLFAYTIFLEHDGSVDNNEVFAMLRLYLDGKPDPRSASQYHPRSNGQSSDTLSGFFYQKLEAAEYTVELKWSSTGRTTWSNNPTLSDHTSAGRSLIVMALYQ